MVPADERDGRGCWSSLAVDCPARRRLGEGRQQLCADPAAQRLEHELELGDGAGDIALLVVGARLVELVGDLVGPTGAGATASPAARRGEAQTHRFPALPAAELQPRRRPVKRGLAAARATD